VVVSRPCHTLPSSRDPATTPHHCHSTSMPAGHDKSHVDRAATTRPRPSANTGCLPGSGRATQLAADSPRNHVSGGGTDLPTGRSKGQSADNPPWPAELLPTCMCLENTSAAASWSRLDNKQRTEKKKRCDSGDGVIADSLAGLSCPSRSRGKDGSSQKGSSLQSSLPSASVAGCSPLQQSSLPGLTQSPSHSMAARADTEADVDVIASTTQQHSQDKVSCC